ncbi:MAG: tryptophan synthase subunit alpha [Candidatus Omnitrophota bacterium]
MNRIDKTFSELKKKKKKAFIPYITAGDPDLATTEKIVVSLERSGADIVEIGIPFSDPIADGPVIQKAVQRSLLAGCSVKGVFEMVKNVRKKVDLPIVFMTYYNIIYRMGVKRFVEQAALSGADGIIVPDLPLEEAGDLLKEAAKRDFCVIMLTSPTTSPERYKKIAASSRGFVYHVSLTGVTGIRSSITIGLKSDLAFFGKRSKKPVCVGFGISGPGQASEIAKIADGVIVGSAIVRIIEENSGKKRGIPRKVELFASRIADAVHAV